MMFVFFGLFVLLCLYKVQLKPTDGQKYMTDYMSVDKTMSIKGIFILLVFFSHFNSYVKFTSPADIEFAAIFTDMGQAMVTMFLFYSGYGVTESIKKKGISYVHKIPVTRILGTYFRFAFAVILFIVVQAFRGYTFPASQYLLSFLGWESVGNSNWYIFVVVIAYFITFLGFELFRDKCRYILSASAVTAGCIAYIFILFFFKKFTKKTGKP